MTDQTTTTPPACPECADNDIVQPVLLVEHGYHMSPVVWDETVSDWVTTPDGWLMGWNGDETYWQCPACHWQGGDPIGLLMEND